MNDEYIIINKKAIQKMREELNKGSAHWDGIYISDYQQGQIDLIDVIILTQSTPLIPEIEKAFNAGFDADLLTLAELNCTVKDYISNLKLDV